MSSFFNCADSFLAPFYEKYKLVLPGFTQPSFPGSQENSTRKILGGGSRVYLIKASILGKFIPSVSVGERVYKNQFIGVIETAKMNSMLSSGIKGTVISVASEENVQYGDVVVKIRELAPCSSEA